MWVVEHCDGIVTGGFCTDHGAFDIARESCEECEKIEAEIITNIENRDSGRILREAP